MSIATAIQNAQQKVANAYTAVNAKGGTLPATQDLSNLPTAINSISGGGMDTVEAYNNTGSAISTGDKVWINQDDAYVYNFDVIGWSVIDNTTNVISDFGQVNFIQTKDKMTLGTNDFEFGIKFKLNTAPSSGNNAVICSILGDRWFDIQLTNGRYLKVEIGDGSSYVTQVTSSTTQIQTLTWYWVKVIRTSGVLSVLLSTDGETYTTEIAGTANTTNIQAGTLAYGVNRGRSSSAIFTGSIDLSETYIKINNTLWLDLSITKVSADYILKSYEEFDKDKLIVEDMPLVSSTGAVSAFTGTSYITVGTLPFNSTNSWSMDIEFTTGNDVTNAQALFVENNTNYNSVLSVQSGKVSLALSSNHSSTNIGSIATTTQVNANTTYTAKVEFTGSAYNLYLNDVLENSITSSTKLMDFVWNLGCANAPNSQYDIPFGGSINTAKTKVVINGNVYWSPLVSTVTEDTLTGTAAENIAVSGTGDVEVGTVITPPTKKYNLLDRVKDDSNNEIGTVSGFFTDANNVEYAVVCLDAQYRLASGKWYSSTSETVTNLPNYNDTTWGPWEAKETATFNTQKILDSCAESGDTSTACSHCRTLSFTVDGTTYYGQLPNMIELYEIVRNHTAINAKDTTASSYSSVDLASIKNIWSSSQFSNNYAWFACSAYGDFSIDDKRYDNMVIPVLEIPNT